jgi:hypothetical protein
MNTIKVQIIAYVTIGIINLVGFVYLVGETHDHGSTETPQYEAAPYVPQDLSSWFSGRP